MRVSIVLIGIVLLASWVCCVADGHQPNAAQFRHSLVDMLSEVPSTWRSEVAFHNHNDNDNGDADADGWFLVDGNTRLQPLSAEQSVTIHLPPLDDDASGVSLFSEVVCEEYRVSTSIRNGRCVFVIDPESEFYNEEQEEVEVYFNYEVQALVSRAHKKGKSRNTNNNNNNDNDDSKKNAATTTSSTTLYMSRLGGETSVPHELGRITLSMAHEALDTELQRVTLTFAISTNSSSSSSEGAAYPQLPAALRLTGMIGDFSAHEAKQALAASSSIIRRWLHPIMFGFGVYYLLWGLTWVMRRRQASAAAAAARAAPDAKKAL